MAYNPYNTYKKIVARKGDWHNAKSLGQDPGQYYQAAIPLYQELYDNGYGELADELSLSDYTTSKGLGAKYGLKPDEQFNMDNAFNDMTGNAGESGGQKSVYSGIDPTANNSVIDNFVNQIQNGTDMMNGTYQTAQGIATGAIQTQPSAVTQGMFNAYNDQNNRLNGAIQYDANGNVISGLNTEHYNIGRNQLDYLNNFDVTKQPYYQGIMDAYNLGGYNAAQGEYANGAADNGGNIDSYAAANANRQQLAFTTAGMQQAMAMANQNQQNWQNLYSQMSDDLNNQGQLSLQTLEQARLMYATDAEERMKALDNAGSLAKADLEAKIRAYEQAVQERMDDKKITSDEAMQEADLAEQKARLEMEIARDLEQSNIESRTRQYESDNTLKGTLDANEKDYNARIHESDNNLAGTYDTNYTSRSNNAANNYTDQLKAQLGYQSDMAGYQNALDKIYAQTAGDMELAKFNNMSAEQLQKWMLENGYLPSGVTLQNPGTGTTPENGNNSSVDPQLADAYQMTSYLVQLYNTHGDASLITPADVYAAAMEYDNEQYGGAHQKEIYTYINNFMNLGKKATSNDDLLSSLISGMNP